MQPAKNPQDSAKRLAALLRKIAKTSKHAPEQASGDAMEVLVMSFLIWDSTTTKAVAAYKRIRERIVDFNDLRVSMAHEVVEWIGPRYPTALERCERMRAAVRHT